MVGRCVENAPPMFFACQEARAEVNKSYKPFRGTHPISPVVYRDFSKDYLCLTSQSSFALRSRFFGDLLPKEARDSLRGLVLSEITFLADFSDGVASESTEEKFKFTELQLDELVIVSYKFRPKELQLHIAGLDDVDEDVEQQRRTSGDCQMIEVAFARWKKESPGWLPPSSRILKFQSKMSN